MLRSTGRQKYEIKDPWAQPSRGSGPKPAMSGYVSASLGDTSTTREWFSLPSRNCSPGRILSSLRVARRSASWMSEVLSYVLPDRDQLRLISITPYTTGSNLEMTSGFTHSIPLSCTKFHPAWTFVMSSANRGLAQRWQTLSHPAV